MVECSVAVEALGGMGYIAGMDVVLIIVGVVVGAALGAGAGYLLCERRRRGREGELATAAAVAEQRLTDAAVRLEAERNETGLLRQKLGEAEKDAAGLTAQLEASRQNLAEQRRLLEEAHQQLKQAFASVSAEALAKNSETFLQLAGQRFETLSTKATGSLEEKKAQIEGLLKPVRELLNTYQQRLGEIEKSRGEAYSGLREQIGMLAESHRSLSTQTTQLVTALSRPQSRGRWGEIALRRLVELAGMTNYCDFDEQVSSSGEDGRLRPDMVVNLPGGRQVVIDSKAVFPAFQEACSAADEATRRQLLLRHSQQVRNHAKELCSKGYWQRFKTCPEFVVMFIPGEAFLYAAVEHDQSLLEECLESKVILATPTTLLALLRAIEFGWRQEAISENAEEIRTLGKELYDRIVTMAGHFQKLGGSIDMVVRSYNQAIGSVESRVMVTARKMGELGARSDKELPELSPVDKQPRELGENLKITAEAQREIAEVAEEIIGRG
jgi:DNA recombination protein RmuC